MKCSDRPAPRWLAQVSSPHRRLTSIVGIVLALAGVAAGAGEDLCLFVSAENLTEGEADDDLWLEISTAGYTIQPGDHLEYDLFLPSRNPVLKGMVGVVFDSAAAPEQLRGVRYLHQAPIKNQEGQSPDLNTELVAARDRWHHESYDLTPLAGAVIQRWVVIFEGDEPGRYVQLLDGLRITREGQAVHTVYESGPAPDPRQFHGAGYSQAALVTSVPRQDAYSSEELDRALEQARGEFDLRVARDQFHAELEVAAELAKRLGDADLQKQLEQAAAMEDQVAFEQRNAARYFDSLHRARHELSHAHAQMQRFSGHLVGHAHIDLQWLWSWEETTDQIIPQTFGQALKFMEEFPEFTFSQSSAALYLATEERHPELFRRIQEKVRAGQWEIVGGRWCEGDNNLISPESHVRQLLYGQRYFQSRFGRICTVGWEPDTFGHCWTMPQILRQAGIDSYYFCRAGKNVPLFWWQGPDGSRVLTFEEPATGGWYNDVVNDEKVRELARFALGTGAFDHLMVYGVGNHGGGPTREFIEAALAMRQRAPWPNIRFSTAEEFFSRLHAMADELKAPTLNTELNPVFEGCYTTHARIKRFNRQAESLLESAEVFAALATARGEAYPRRAFEDMWRDVLWSHHHDTLPGSFVHPSYLYSVRVYEQLLERGQNILERAQRRLIREVAADTQEQAVAVFNALAWPRSEVVEVRLTVPAALEEVAFRDEQGDVPSQVLRRQVNGDTATIEACFVARDVPGCGYKLFEVLPGPNGPRETEPVLAPPSGLRPTLQILHEKPHGMSAWQVGEFSEVKDLGEPASVEVLEEGPVRRRVRETWRFDKSTIIQDTLSYAGADRVDFETEIEWLQVGSAADGGPMLKVAFPTGVSTAEATYDIPFGDIARPNDGHENVALKWCAVSDDRRTVAVLNDCKHAYDVKDGVVRLTLLRTSYEPDPTPDVGLHRMRYAAWLQDRPLDKAAVARAAWAFNKPLRAVLVNGAVGTAGGPTVFCGCAVEPQNIVLTSLKCGEDDDNIVLRAYECSGRATTAQIALGFEAVAVEELDLLERRLPTSERMKLEIGAIQAEFRPYEIRTIRVVRGAQTDGVGAGR